MNLFDVQSGMGLPDVAHPEACRHRVLPMLDDGAVRDVVVVALVVDAKPPIQLGLKR